MNILVIFLHYLLRGQIHCRSPTIEHQHLSFVLKSQKHTSQDILASLMGKVRLIRKHNFTFNECHPRKWTSEVFLRESMDVL